MVRAAVVRGGCKADDLPAFIAGELEVPKHRARRVHDLYSDPPHDELAPRTMWSLSNAFTSAFKELHPIPQFKATAKLVGFLEAWSSPVVLAYRAVSADPLLT